VLLKEGKIVKKIWMAFVVVLLVVFTVNAEVNKEELFSRIAQKYAGIQDMSGRYEMNMSMMGSMMKMPASFWKKGDKMRMDMSFSQPGMPKPMEMSMLMDSEKIIQYQKTLNTVMTVDMSKLPEELRNSMKQQTGVFDAKMIQTLQSVIEEVEVIEKNRDGKNFYLIKINNTEKIRDMMSIPGVQQNTQQFFKKVSMWVNRDSLLLEKMEIYGEDSNTPGMWIDFLEFKTDSIPDSVFNLNIPKDAKVMDMTDMVKNMAGAMKQSGSK
jgi:outer membrane lipoprotein-sorting protein